MNGRVLLRWLLFTGLIISFTTDIFMFIWVWQSEVSSLDGTTTLKIALSLTRWADKHHMCVFANLPNLKCSFKYWKQNFEAGSETGQEDIRPSGLKHDNLQMLVIHGLCENCVFALLIRSLSVSHHSGVNDWTGQGFVSVHGTLARGKGPSLKEYTSTSVCSPLENQL